MGGNPLSEQLRGKLVSLMSRLIAETLWQAFSMRCEPCGGIRRGYNPTNAESA